MHIIKGNACIGKLIDIKIVIYLNLSAIFKQPPVWRHIQRAV